MSAPATLEALLILGLVFVPGYLFLIFARRSNIGAPEKLEARDFLMMLAIGATIHLLALLVPFGTPWLIGWYVEGSRDEQIGLVGLWALFVIILGPIGIGMFSGALLAKPQVNTMLDKVGLSFVDRIPSA